jgi:hypothetical protein
MSDMMTMSRALLADFERKAAMEERERIIEILEAELTYKEYDLRVYLIDKINGAV